MANKITTLKDMEQTRTEADSNYNMKKIKYVDSEELRKEARKWIKDWEFTLSRTETLLPDEMLNEARRLTRIECEFAIKWVSKFFDVLVSGDEHGK